MVNPLTNREKATIATLTVLISVWPIMSFVIANML